MGALGRSVVMLAAVAALAADVLLANVVTGGLALAAMIVAIVGLTHGVIDLRETGRRVVRRAGLLKLEASTLVALLGLLAGRAYIVYRGFVPSDGTELERAQAARTYTVLFALLAVVALVFVRASARVALALLRAARRPALLLAGSFASLIGVGTLLLALPFSVNHVADISLVDALFTMTSAVCVTGLTVNDVATTYSIFGQAVVLAGIQLGGIGIMTLAALVLTFRGADLRAQGRYQTLLDARNLEDLRATIRGLVVTTFVIEAAGAALLWLVWEGDPRLEGRSAAWMAVFHAISAFCNAGFALWPGNLTVWQHDAGVQAVLMALIVLGGIGFPVIRELHQRGLLWATRSFRRVPPPHRRLTLATRTVLGTTAVLVLTGTYGVAVLEAGNVLAPLGVVDGALAALFTSVTARTAGFNTIDFGQLRDATLLLVMVLMFIGGSPASAAGGVKTTTIATIFAALKSELRGVEPHLGGRALPPEVIRRATAVTALSLVLVIVATMVLSLTEDQPFVRVAFEATSAFATVGLSTGITPDLTIAGKLVVMALMFVGRVGPLTVAVAIGETGHGQRHRLAPENLPIG